MRPLLIFPCNGNGLEALDCLGDAYELIGFIDDTPEKQGSDARGFTVFDRSALTRWPNAYVLAVPGCPELFRTRRQMIDGLGIDPDRFATVVHSAARVSPLARIGRNVLIMAGAVVTSNAVIGEHVCVLPNTVIHHDVNLGPWSLVGSGVSIAGGTRIGANCYVGSGSTIMNDLEIGEGALIGLGSSVIRDVESGSTVAGNPARPLR